MSLNKPFEDCRHVLLLSWYVVCVSQGFVLLPLGIEINNIHCLNVLFHTINKFKNLQFINLQRNYIGLVFTIDFN